MVMYMLSWLGGLKNILTNCFKISLEFCILYIYIYMKIKLVRDLIFIAILCSPMKTLTNLIITLTHSPILAFYHPRTHNKSFFFSKN